MRYRRGWGCSAGSSAAVGRLALNAGQTAFEDLVLTNNHVAVARAAVAAIRAAATKATYEGKDLTNLPGVIANMKPGRVLLFSNEMVIIF